MPAARLAHADPRLLSIVALDLGAGFADPNKPHRYLAAFHIDTWAVRVLAVCHVPAGWLVTAGQYGDPGGELSGQAGVGAAFLDAEGAAGLHAMFLVDIDETDRGQTRPECGPPTFVQSVCGPPTFGGRFEIGEYGENAEPDRVSLDPTNIRLTAAERCPGPF